MKKTILLICGIICHITIYAQSLNVNIGQTTYKHNADNTGDMLFSNGTTLTVEGKTYNISDISNIVIDDNTVEDNTVSVVYNGNSANIVVAGNIAKYLTIAANGANVSILQDAALAEEITYTLSGSSNNGSFFMDGDYKATLALDNLTLTNTNGAPIDIENGKRINVILTGTNTLTDSSNGTHNACLYIDGHPDFNGTGTLTITGNTKHGITSGDYMLVNSGTIMVLSAISDGIHAEQYFQMDGGNITINATGDGIDCGFKGVNKGTKDTYENNGFIFLNNGTLNITSTGNASKGVKCDSSLVVTGGNITVTTSGAAYYDTAESDVTSSSAMKCDGSFTMSGGSVALLSTGSGGKGLNATGNINISGGTLSAVTTGDRYKYNSEIDSKPQGIKSDGDIILSGGNIYSAVKNSKATSFKTDFTFSVNGATIMGIGGKEVFPSGSQSYKTYTSTVTGGQTVNYNGVSFTVPSNYSYSNAFIIVSSPSM